MPESNRPLKVFLSYASQDRPPVRELSRRLVGEGWIETWFDEKSLLPGEDWRLKIEEAVEDSDVVIICLSSNSVTKEGYVQKELRYAREIALEKPDGTIFLIPLRLDECEVPRGLRFYQWVDYFGERKDESYDALTESLKLRYEQKLRLEEAERARKKKLEAERIAREEATHEKAKRDAEEKARLEAEKQARQKAEKEKVEHEAAEKARLEAENKERQKVAHEKAAREKKTPSEKLKQKTRPKPVEEKPNQANGETTPLPKEPVQVPQIKTKTNSPTIFGFLSFTGFLVFIGLVAVLLIINLLASNNGNMPQTFTPTLTETIAPTKTPTPSATESSDPKFTETPTVSIILADNSKKLYFISEDKYLNVIDTLSGQSRQLIQVKDFNDYLDSKGVFTGDDPTITWLTDSDLAIWLSNRWFIYDLVSSQQKVLISMPPRSDIVPSDIQGGYVYYYTKTVSEKTDILYSSIAKNKSSVYIGDSSRFNIGDLRSPFCLRKKPDDPGRVAVVMSELNGSVLGPPSLVLFRPTISSNSPVVVKKQVDGCISWSPDGKFIAYGNGKPRYDSAKSFPKGIFYVDIVSGVTVKVSDRDGYYPVWSANGSMVAFITKEGIFLVDVNTKEERQIYSGNAFALLWGK